MVKKKQYIEIEKIDWKEIKEALKCYPIIIFLDAALILMLIISMLVPIWNLTVLEDVVGIRNKVKLKHKVKYEVKNFKDKE